MEDTPETQRLRLAQRLREEESKIEWIYEGPSTWYENRIYSDDGYVTQFFLEREGFEYIDISSQHFPRTIAQEEDLSEFELIRQIQTEDKELPFPSELKRFCISGLISSVNTRVNNHIEKGHTLFPTTYAIEAFQFQAKAVRRNEEGGFNYYSVALTAPFSRILINKVRNFVKFLEAFTKYALEVLATKKVLVDHLDFLATGSILNDTWETNQLTQTYIFDLAILKRFIVKLAAYHSLIDRQRHFLIKSQISWDLIRGRLSLQFQLPVHIIDIIEDFLVYGETSPRSEVFSFQVPRNPRSRFIAGEGEDIASGNWSILTLKRVFEAYLYPREFESNNRYPCDKYHYPNLSVKSKVAGYGYRDLFRYCLSEIKVDIYCLSFERSDKERSARRNPWFDHVTYFDNPGLQALATDRAPYAWMEGELIAIIPVEEI